MTAIADTQLHFLRHAHAGDPMKWHGPDEVRPLTEKGRRQSEGVGRFLAAAGFRPDAILTSPKTRALETAQIVAAELGIRAEAVRGLGVPLDLDSLDELLHAAGDPVRPLLVGHDPDFSMLAAELSGVTELPIRKATLVRIDCPRPLSQSTGILRWLVPPELLAPDGLND